VVHAVKKKTASYTKKNKEDLPTLKRRKKRGKQTARRGGKEGCARVKLGWMKRIMSQPKHERTISHRTILAIQKKSPKGTLKSGRMGRQISP